MCGCMFKRSAFEFPMFRLSWSGRSGKRTRLVVKTSATEFFLKNDTAMSMLPIVGSIVNVSSEILPARMKGSSTCWWTGTILPLEISILLFVSRSWLIDQGLGRGRGLQECGTIHFKTEHSGWRLCPEWQIFHFHEIVKVSTTFSRSSSVSVWQLDVAAQVSVDYSSHKVFFCVSGVFTSNN